MQTAIFKLSLHMVVKGVGGKGGKVLRSRTVETKGRSVLNFDGRSVF